MVAALNTLVPCSPYPRFVGHTVWMVSIAKPTTSGDRWAIGLLRSAVIGSIGARRDRAGRFREERVTIDLEPGRESVSALPEDREWEGATPGEEAAPERWSTTCSQVLRVQVVRLTSICPRAVPDVFFTRSPNWTHW